VASQLFEGFGAWYGVDVVANEALLHDFFGMGCELTV
jgi:hypothetical protein